ncbi:RNA 2',3'-cyclic phosphodiesterase [Collinsella tanakaei]|uniref:RNA 2',3'-cyclic phosphodiesterase n=1 Tax=Collinsella tanakaei TaxID=626935 RepID=UPI00195B8258|nr:RNA 2',3'-cyclic phosphodiesterase [Collinsella tanakaei]MBM6778572.1 RNA 2',3'-cyclic phosphodiesterase [Collinsella tanakaei]
MRAFIALELPYEFEDELAGCARQLASVVSGRFMKRSTYHVTLAFLGDIDEGEARNAMDALDAACADMGPVPLSAEGLGTFGRPRDATLWLGLARSTQLMDLASRVRTELESRGIAFDAKPFLPHITLVRRARIPAGALPDLPFPLPAEATDVTLFKSILDQSGATYKPLYTVELR